LHTDEQLGRVVAIAACLPQLVQSRTPDHQRGVELEAVGAESGVLKVLAELPHVALVPDVWQVRHHVRHDFVPGVLSKMEAFAHCPHGVPAVGVARHVFVDALHADFEPRAAVGEHVAEVRLETVVRARFNGDPDAL